jgi:hypothetical protein
MRSRRDFRQERAEIAGRLAEQADSLARELFPNGQYRNNRREWHVGSLAGERGQHGGSLVIWLKRRRRGKWKEFGGVIQYGDMLDLLVRIEGGGDFLKGLHAAKQRLGLADISSEERKRWRARAAKRAAAEAQQAQREAAANSARAREIFDLARPVVRGDLVARYLEGRGISLSQLGRVPNALRFHPRLWAAPDCFLPAMVAAVTDGKGEFCSVHRTFLRVDGGRVTKAETGDDANKRLLGPSAGGSIKLWRGVSRKSWANMPLHETILLSEGIEDLLSALQIAEVGLRSRSGRLQYVAACELRGVVGVSLSFMQRIELPAEVERVVVLAQRDAADSPARRGLDAVIERFRQQRREVLLLPPPAWPGLKDLNDLAQRL